MNIFEYIKSFFIKPEVRNFGIIDEDIYNKAFCPTVYSQKEVVASISTPTFKGIKGDGTIRKFAYQYQDGSSSCVAFTTAKIAQVFYYLLNNRIIKWSPGFWYVQRSNKPEGGMAFSDITKLASLGSVTNELLPSEGLSETAINSLDITDYLKDTADGFAISPNWVELPLDFDTVASTIEATKKPIMLWFRFYSGEFFYTSYPKIVGNNMSWRHSVTAIDTATINSKQYIVIEDSADYESNYIKYISREFFSRCFLARYPINFKFALTETTKPVFDGSVKSLQDVLKYEGMMASNIPSTGYLGEITRLALVQFQKKYGITPSVGFFGDITKKKLLELYH